MGQFVNKCWTALLHDLQCGEFRPTPMAMARVALGLCPPLPPTEQSTTSARAESSSLLLSSTVSSCFTTSIQHSELDGRGYRTIGADAMG
jgi:hypothetical protein